jgi:hypothetical protein
MLKTGQYVYRLDCGEVFAGDEGLAEGTRRGVPCTVPRG